MNKQAGPLETLRIGVWPTKRSVLDLLPSDLGSLAEWIDLGAAPDAANGCVGIVTAGSGQPGSGSAARGSGTAVAGFQTAEVETPAVWPLYTPVVHVTELQDPAKRDAFFEQVIGRANLERVFSPGWTIAHLVAFNIRERYRVLVHDPKQHRLMGRLIAKAKDHPREVLEAQIRGHYMDALAKPVTPRKHANLFAHVLELLEDRIDAGARDEIDAAVAGFVAGRTSLLVPLDRLATEVAKLRVAGLEAQTYLHPDAKERALRFGGGTGERYSDRLLATH